jgi:hypothetical protein
LVARRVHGRDAVAGAHALDVPRVLELGEDAPDLSAGDIDRVGDVNERPTVPVGRGVTDV